MGYTFHKKIIGAAVANGYAFAMCRLPQKQLIKTYIAFDKPTIQPVNIGSERCFVFSSFNHADEAFVLTPSLYYEDEKLLTTDQTDQRQFGFLHQTSALSNQQLYYPSAQKNSAIDEQHYINLVNLAVDAINKNEFKKLVAARCIHKKINSNFDIIKYFFNLCEEYTNAFVYVYSSPQTGTWIGATPEKLVTVENSILQTVALAGTLSKKSTESWSKKEREEQTHVEDFIANVFSKIGISDYKKGKVQTVAAGNLRHLSSNFSWQETEEEIHKNFPEFLKELNPTPAVCGLPKQEAALFLQEHEGFERRFYSGFTGVIDKTSTHLFVNLRCMELMKTETILYAGAGITSDSIAEKEWQETERKMQTLEDLL